ncbi:hypothetical protein [Streptomyces sp. TR02-1]|uniref:hypothetical protein n=1 Tax=Streptomyces sp. TR02-1 TaxID=3385977 RepID=UPI0039A14E09
MSGQGGRWTAEQVLAPDAASGRRGGGPAAAGREVTGRRPAPRAARRVARIAAGAGELEQRLEDWLREGLATSGGLAPDAREETAARMVDAQAPGLAAGVRALDPSAGSAEDGPERLLADCALLHLLARACRDLTALPEPLAATVRARAGLTVDRAAVLADPGARLRDDWLVLARREEQEGRLTARRTWLLGRRSRRTALLLGFTAPGRAPEPALPVGAVLDADLAFHPGAPPLRAALGARHSEPRVLRGGFAPAAGDGPAASTGSTTGDALAAYGRALGDDPWLDAWPVVLADVVPLPPSGSDGWQVADASGGTALPVAPDVPAASLWRLAAVSGGGPLTVFGECGHRGFVPHTAWPARDGCAVPL